uniref:Uncharacterized protein n=1 Tax=Octopus bimaculoides TaxID=37653 RepID=A0A0L8HU06_OCTBM
MVYICVRVYIMHICMCSCFNVCLRRVCISVFLYIYNIVCLQLDVGCIDVFMYVIECVSVCLCK